VIELLGVGVQGGGGQWLLHRVCARLEPGVLTAVVAGTPAQSAALIDAATGLVIPSEGRVWVERRPLMRETAGRIRARVADVTRATPYGLGRSALWNTLIAGSPLAGLLRFPRRSERESALRALDAVGLGGRAREPMAALTTAERLRVGLARALFRKAAAVVFRDLDAAVGPDDAAALLCLARSLARVERVVAIASLAAPALARAHADRAIVLAEGLLVFEGRAVELADGQVSRRLGAVRP
jgi:ABC-type phosphate/phosphonate transport system ATPase subunit